MEPFSLVGWMIEKLGLPASWGSSYLHVVMSVVALVYIAFFSFLAWRRLRHTESCVLPDGYTTVTNIFEIIVGAVLRLMIDVMGPKARSHLPLVGSLFIYILVCNLMGVIPGLVPPTADINTNMACALVVFLYYNIVGIRRHGLKEYLRHMAGPVVWLAPLLFAIEIVSHLVRPVSLSVRLMGNIVGDHMVVGIFSQLVPLLLPIVFIALSIFVSFMQAFVFALLTIVYIEMAEASEEQ